MDKEQAQDILDNFVMSNDADIDRVSKQNPILYNAVIDGLDFLSKKFGTGVQTPKKEIKEELKVEELKMTINIGDTFINKYDPSIIFKVLSSSGGVIGFVDAEKGENSFLFTTPTDIGVKNFESGKWVKVEPQDLTDEIKVGSRFVLMSSAKNNPNDPNYMFLVTEISERDVKTKYSKKGLLTNFLYNPEYLKEYIKKGDITLINEGDIFFDTSDPISEFEVISPFMDVAEFNYKLIWSGEKRSVASWIIADKIVNKYWKKSKVKDLKVGDKFWILNLKKSAELVLISGEDYYIKFEGDPTRELYSKEQIKEQINSGSWDIMDSKPKAEDKFKIGESFKNNFGSTYVISSIDKDDVIQFIINGKSLTRYSTEDFKKGLEIGTFKRDTGNAEPQKSNAEEKFKVGDEFKSGVGEIYKITQIDEDNVIHFIANGGKNYLYTEESLEYFITKGGWSRYTSKQEPQKSPKTAKGGDTKRSLTKAIEGLELLESFGSLDANEMAELKDLRERLDKLTKK